MSYQYDPVLNRIIDPADPGGIAATEVVPVDGYAIEAGSQALELLAKITDKSLVTYRGEDDARGVCVFCGIPVSEVHNVDCDLRIARNIIWHSKKGELGR